MGDETKKVTQAVAGAAAGSGGGEGRKKKFDPETLPEDLKPIYRAMLADYTKKTQALEREREAMATEFANLNTAVQTLQQQIATLQSAPGYDGQGQYYGQAPGQYGALGQSVQTGAQAQLPPWLRDIAVDTSNYDAFNPESVAGIVRNYVGAALGSYHRLLEQEYQRLIRGLVEQQAMNVQLMRLIARDPNLDIEKVIQAAPQYGNNLEQAYRAVHESPKVWEKARQSDELEKTIAQLNARIKEMEAKTTPTSILGGTTGPIPRTVAKGKEPRTYEEAAGTISPAEIMATVDGGAPGAGTAGGQVGGSQSQAGVGAG